MSIREIFFILCETYYFDFSKRIFKIFEVILYLYFESKNVKDIFKGVIDND